MSLNVLLPQGPRAARVGRQFLSYPLSLGRVELQNGSHHREKVLKQQNQRHVLVFRPGELVARRYVSNACEVQKVNNKCATPMSAANHTRKTLPSAAAAVARREKPLKRIAVARRFIVNLQAPINRWHLRLLPRPSSSRMCVHSTVSCCLPAADLCEPFC